MKIEMDETSSVTACLISAALILLIGGLGGCYLCEKTKWTAIDTGMEQVTVPGHGFPVWAHTTNNVAK